MSCQNPTDSNKFLHLQRHRTSNEHPPRPPISISRYDKVKAVITGLGVGYLTYEHVPYIPEDSAKATLGIIAGIGAAALDAYTIPAIEAHRAKQ